MPSALVRALHERHGVPLIDAASVEAFLANASHSLLLFAGDPAQRAESNDVAVVMPQLLKAFNGALQGGVVALSAETALKPRFHVSVAPSLVVTRGAEIIDVIPKIRDWSEYVTRIKAALNPDAPALKPSAGPKTEIRINGARTNT